MRDRLVMVKWENWIWLEQGDAKIILSPVEGYEVILKSFGLKARGLIDLVSIDVIDERRFREILERHRKRVEDIVVRELVRLQRIKGLEIEDERAKTYFLCATGYLLRIDYEKRVIDDYIEELKRRIFARHEDIDFLSARAYHYNKLLRDIKKNDMFKHVIEDFKEIILDWTVKRGRIEYEIQIDDVKWYNKTGIVHTSEIVKILRRIRENLEHIFLSLLGKIISGK